MFVSVCLWQFSATCGSANWTAEISKPNVFEVFKRSFWYIPNRWSLINNKIVVLKCVAHGLKSCFGYHSLGNPMDWVSSKVSQSTPFSPNITLPILSEQWHYSVILMFLYKVKLTNMDYNSCSVWLDMCCLTCSSVLLARKPVRPDFETIFSPCQNRPAAD